MPRSATSGSTRYPPSEDLAHLIDRHWVVEWDLREPYTQEIVTHPSVNLALYPDAARVHGVFTGRFRQELVGPRQGRGHASSGRAASIRCTRCPRTR